MANTIHVDVVSAEESIYSGDAEFVVLPGVMGELGIYPKHTPLITQIKPGTVRIKVPGQAEEQIVFVRGGFLEVQPDVVTVLSDTAIRARDLDEAKALEAERGERALAEYIQSAAPKTPWNLWQDGADYALDFAQRSALFWDTLRQRGNNYVDHERAGKPPLLAYEYDVLADGRTFERPVNHA